MSPLHPVFLVCELLVYHDLQLSPVLVCIFFFVINLVNERMSMLCGEPPLSYSRCSIAAKPASRSAKAWILEGGQSESSSEESESHISECASECALSVFLLFDKLMEWCCFGVIVTVSSSMVYPVSMLLRHGGDCIPSGRAVCLHCSSLMWLSGLWLPSEHGNSTRTGELGAVRAIRVGWCFASSLHPGLHLPGLHLGLNVGVHRSCGLCDGLEHSG